MLDLLSYFLFQPVLHDCGMCYPVCGMVQIKDSLLLITIITIIIILLLLLIIIITITNIIYEIILLLTIITKMCVCYSLTGITMTTCFQTQRPMNQLSMPASGVVGKMERYV